MSHDCVKLAHFNLVANLLAGREKITGTAKLDKSGSEPLYLLIYSFRSLPVYYIASRTVHLANKDFQNNTVNVWTVENEVVHYVSHLGSCFLSASSAAIY